MLTHEKVLKVFGPYLDADPDYEVVKTSRGYTLLAWNNRREEWFSAEFCKTPESLRDALLDAYVNYLEYVVTDEGRDPTEQEMREIQKKRQAMYEECMKEGTVMRLILKILAAPLVVALTLFVWICTILLYCTGMVLGLAALVVALLGVAVLVTYSLQNGIILLVIAFLISPMGLPTAAAWLLGKVQSLRYAIQDRVYR